MPNGVLTGLIYGAVLGAATVILISAMIWWNAEILLREYPPDIRQAHGQMSRRARRQHIIASVVFIGVFVSIFAASYQHLAVTSGGQYTFRAASVHALIALTVVIIVVLIVVARWTDISSRRWKLSLSYPASPSVSGRISFHLRGF